MRDVNTMTADEMRAEIARLNAIVTAKVSIKLTEKGGISVYGLGRWPITLYASQWRTLLGHSEAIQAFITQNQDRLNVAEAAWQAAKASAAASAAVVAVASDPVADKAALMAAEIDARLNAA